MGRRRQSSARASLKDKALTRAEDRRTRPRDDFAVVDRQYSDARGVYRRLLALLPDAEREARIERHAMHRQLIELAGDPPAPR